MACAAVADCLESTSVPVDNNDDHLSVIYENQYCYMEMEPSSAQPPQGSLFLEECTVVQPRSSIPKAPSSICSNASTVTTGENDELMLGKLAEIEGKEKQDDKTFSVVVEIWKLVAEEANSHRNIFFLFERLIKATAQAILAATWAKVSEDAKIHFGEYLTTSAVCFENDDEPRWGSLCRNILLMLNTNIWQLPHLQQVFEGKSLTVDTANVLWDAEGCAFLEARVEKLCQIKAYDNALILAEACVLKGQSIYKNDQSKNPIVAGVGPFRISKDKYYQFAAVFALLLHRQDVDDETHRFVQMKKYLCCEFCLETTDRLLRPEDIKIKRVAAKWTKGWKYAEEAALQFLESAILEAIQAEISSSDLAKLFSRWLHLYRKQGADKQKSKDQFLVSQSQNSREISPQSELPIEELDLLVRSCCNKAYLYVFGDCLIEVFDLNPWVRSKCLDLYVPALLRDINELESLKADEKSKRESVECAQKLSQHYQKLAGYFSEDEQTRFELLLTCFSLNPTKELLVDLCNIAERSESVNGLCKSTSAVNICENVSAAKKASDLGLSPLSYEGLITVITNPRWTRLNCFRESWQDFKPLCVRHLETRGEDIKGVNDLELVTPDYSKYEDLKPIYDDNDNGYEPGYGPAEGHHDFQNDRERKKPKAKVKEPSHRLVNLDKLLNRRGKETTKRKYTYQNKLKRLGKVKVNSGRNATTKTQKLKENRRHQTIHDNSDPSIRSYDDCGSGAQERPRKASVQRGRKEQILKRGRPRKAIRKTNNGLPQSLPMSDDRNSSLIPYLPIPFPPESTFWIYHPDCSQGIPNPASVSHWIVSSPGDNSPTTHCFCQSHGSVNFQSDSEQLDRLFRHKRMTADMIKEKKKPNLSKLMSGVHLNTNFTSDPGSWNSWMNFAKWDNITPKNSTQKLVDAIPIDEPATVVTQMEVDVITPAPLTGHCSLEIQDHALIHNSQELKASSDSETVLKPAIGEFNNQVDLNGCLDLSMRVSTASNKQQQDAFSKDNLSSETNLPNAQIPEPVDSVDLRNDCMPGISCGREPRVTCAPSIAMLSPVLFGGIDIHENMISKQASHEVFHVPALTPTTTFEDLAFPGFPEGFLHSFTSPLGLLDDFNSSCNYLEVPHKVSNSSSDTISELPSKQIEPLVASLAPELGVGIDISDTERTKHVASPVNSVFLLLNSNQEQEAIDLNKEGACAAGVTNSSVDGNHEQEAVDLDEGLEASFAAGTTNSSVVENQEQEAVDLEGGLEVSFTAAGTTNSSVVENQEQEAVDLEGGLEVSFTAARATDLSVVVNQEQEALDLDKGLEVAFAASNSSVVLDETFSNSHQNASNDELNLLDRPFHSDGDVVAESQGSCTGLVVEQLHDHPCLEITSMVNGNSIPSTYAECSPSVAQASCAAAEEANLVIFPEISHDKDDDGFIAILSETSGEVIKVSEFPGHIINTKGSPEPDMNQCSENSSSSNEFEFENPSIDKDTLRNGDLNPSVQVKLVNLRDMVLCLTRLTEQDLLKWSRPMPTSTKPLTTVETSAQNDKRNRRRTVAMDRKAVITRNSLKNIIKLEDLECDEIKKDPVEIVHCSSETPKKVTLVDTRITSSKTIVPRSRQIELRTLKRPSDLSRKSLQKCAKRRKLSKNSAKKLANKVKAQIRKRVGSQSEPELEYLSASDDPDYDNDETPEKATDYDSDYVISDAELYNNESGSDAEEMNDRVLPVTTPKVPTFYRSILTSGKNYNASQPPSDCRDPLALDNFYLEQEPSITTAGQVCVDFVDLVSDSENDDTESVPNFSHELVHNTCTLNDVKPEESLDKFEPLKIVILADIITEAQLPSSFSSLATRQTNFGGTVSPPSRIAGQPETSVLDFSQPSPKRKISDLSPKCDTNQAHPEKAENKRSRSPQNVPEVVDLNVTPSETSEDILGKMCSDGQGGPARGNILECVSEVLNEIPPNNMQQIPATVQDLMDHDIQIESGVELSSCIVTFAENRTTMTYLKTLEKARRTWSKDNNFGSHCRVRPRLKGKIYSRMKEEDNLFIFRRRCSGWSLEEPVGSVQSNDHNIVGE